MTKPEQIDPSIPPDGATVTPYGWAKFNASKWPKTKRQASEIEKEAALALVEVAIAELHTAANPRSTWIMYDEIIAACNKYTEAYDYAKSIGAIETLNHSDTKTQGE